MKGTLFVADSKKVYALKIDDIVRLESKGIYTLVFTKDKRQYVFSRHLKSVLSEITSKNFFRVHKSHVVNLKEVTVYEKGRGGAVCMSDGCLIPVSQRKKSSFLKQLHKK